MIRLPTFPLVSDADFLQEDSGIECACLWHDGAQIYLVIGGQTGGWGERERLWVYDRLTGGPHQALTYSGYWAGQAIGTQAKALNLSLQGATYETDPRRLSSGARSRRKPDCLVDGFSGNSVALRTFDFKRQPDKCAR